MNGDKANDLWKYDLVLEKWNCLHKGDYFLDFNRQKPNEIPTARVGARMVLINEKTLLLHNGHDTDNEKLQDMWKYDLTTNVWQQVEQKGDVPPGRSGHTLVKYKDVLFLYGGILEITKESEDMYAYHIPLQQWIKVAL